MISFRPQAAPSACQNSSQSEQIAPFFRAFSFPGDLNSVAHSRDQVLEFFREHCSDESIEIDLTIALQEALVNAALHGCGNDPGKRISCTVELQPDRAAFAVSDPGSGFDHERIADPAQFEPTTLSHGRGLALLRSVVEGVTFLNGGSEIRFYKRLNC